MANRLIRKLPILLASLVVLPAASCRREIPATVDAALMPAYRVIEPGLAVAGQPSPEALGKLKEMGFRTVVNLRTVQEGPAQERALVEAQGLRYVSVPVSPATLGFADAEALEAVLADSGSQPVLVHCASSNRVGALWALVQACRGKSPAEAEAAGVIAGMRPTLLPAVRGILGGTSVATCRRPGDAAARP